MIHVIHGGLCCCCGLHCPLDFRTGSLPFTLKLEQETAEGNLTSSWCLWSFPCHCFGFVPVLHHLEVDSSNPSPKSWSLFTSESGSECFRCLQSNWAECSSLWEGLQDRTDFIFPLWLQTVLASVLSDGNPMSAGSLRSLLQGACTDFLGLSRPSSRASSSSCSCWGSSFTIQGNQ